MARQQWWRSGRVERDRSKGATACDAGDLGSGRERLDRVVPDERDGDGGLVSWMGIAVEWWEAYGAALEGASVRQDVERLSDSLTGLTGQGQETAPVIRRAKSL